jgi:tetratricopeptide (TPR) repeat protein
MRHVLISFVALLLPACGSAELPAVRAHVLPESTTSSPFEAAYTVGKKHLAADRLGLAIVMFEKALVIDPLSVNALNACGVAYDDLHRYKVALAYYKRALMIEPNSADTYNNMAVSALMSQDYASAEAYFAQAAKLDPNNETIRNNMLALQQAKEPAHSGSTISRGIANNNPLNLEYHAGQTGAIGSDGRFGIYGSMQDGIEAARRQLFRYQSRGLVTIAQIISAWAPTTENQEKTAEYIAAVSKRTGFAPNEPIDVHNPGVAVAIIDAMARQETGFSVALAETASNDLHPQIERTGESELTIVIHPHH